MCLANAVRISMDVYRKEGKGKQVIRFGICKEVSIFRFFYDRKELAKQIGKQQLDRIYKHGLNL